MTSLIRYSIRGTVGDISDFRLGGATLTVAFDGVPAGHLTLGNLSVPIKDGRAAIDCSRLPDGEVRPFLLTGGKRIRLERFAVEGGRLSLLPTEEGVIRELLSRTRRLEEEVSTLKEAVCRLEQRIASDTIF